MLKERVFNLLDFSLIKKNNPDLILRILNMDEVHFKYFLNLAQIDKFLNSDSASFIVESFIHLEDVQLSYYVDIVKKYVENNFDQNYLKLIQFLSFVDITNLYYRIDKILNSITENMDKEKIINDIFYALIKNNHLSFDELENNILNGYYNLKQLKLIS